MSLEKQKASPRRWVMTRRALPALVAAAVLAGCAGTTQSPEATTQLLQARQSLRVYVTGLRPGERVTAVTLIAPDGGETAAPPALVRQQAAGDQGPSRGVSAQGDSDGGVGVGVSFDLIGRLFRDGRSPPRRLGLRGIAEADIPLDDPAALAREPETYRVRVDYRDGDGVARSFSIIPSAS